MAQRGSAVVEFALVVPLVLAMLFGIVEVALVARSQLLVVSAAREGAREAAASTDPGAATQAVRSMLGERGSTARISVRRPGVVGRPARVTVTMPHKVAAPLFGGLSVDLRASASMRVER